MSQPFDVMAASVFAKAALACGIARAGTYQCDEDSQDIVSCTATISMDTTTLGALGTAPVLMGRSAQIALLRSEVPIVPPRGAVVVVDGTKYVIDKVENAQPGFWMTVCTSKGPV